MTANLLSDDISVAINDSTGQFANVTNYLADRNTLDAITGDFDNDGDQDIVSLNGTFAESFSVFKNLGNGSFEAAITTNMSRFARALGSADLNDDGFLDLAFAMEFTDELFVYFGLGDANFSPPVAYAAGPTPTSIKMQDLDLDGDVDVVVGNRLDKQVSVFLNDGSGVLHSDFSISAGIRPASIATGDFDNDGTVDIAVSNEISDDVMVLINQCSPAVVLGDVNQDGIVNLLDVAPFIDLLVDGGFLAEADINQDGVVDLLDVSGFVDLLTGG